MDIHLPSAAGSSGNPSEDIDSKTVHELIAEKDKLEAEIKALGEVLVSHGVNMNTTLTTFDGFPRDDIDIAQIRTTRARIIHLRNDWKALMERIEEGLHDHFATAQNDSGVSNGHSSVSASASKSSNPAQDLHPFAKVNSVIVGSPADQSGLQAGDEILQFGDANWLNHEGLTRVARVVQSSEGVSRPQRQRWNQARLPSGSDSAIDTRGQFYIRLRFLSAGRVRPVVIKRTSLWN